MNEIKPSHRNTNKHTPEGTALLKKSINDFGVLESIATATDGTIITGHARFEQFTENGLKPKFIKLEKDEFAVLETDIENDTKQYYEAQIMANTTANKNFDLDIEMIDVIAEEYDIDIEEVGVDVEEFNDVLEANEDDFENTPPETPITVLGDLYEIGEHRLLCGDSTDSDQVAKLMNGEKADIMVSDPPYGIDLDTDYSKMGATTTKYEKIKGDDKEFDLSDVISISGTKEQYIWGGDYFVNSLDWMSGTQIIWAKRHSEEENKVFGSAFESLWVSYKCKKVIFFIRPINQSSERLGVHPTQKPIECMSRCIEMSKLTGAIYDAFLGSGSTMVASHQLKRKCYGMELDPKYCDVIVRRMIKLDATLKIKRNGTLINNTDFE